MNIERKNVFTVTLDPTKGEAPELLLIALAQAAFDLAEPVCGEGEEFACDTYHKADTLSVEEATKYVIESRRVQLPLFLKGRMCMGEIFASRIAPDGAEIVVRSQEWDPEQLMRLVEPNMATLAAETLATVELALEELDLDDILIIEEDVVPEPTLVAAG